MIKNYLLFLLFSLAAFSTLQAQYLVEAIDLGPRTRAELLAETGLPVQYGVSVYKVLYNTVDIKGNPTVASGLMVFPDAEDLAFPTLVYQHGTVLDRSEVPSNNSFETPIGLLIGGVGYVAVLPDYLGLGDNPGLHPYVHADSEAWAAVDMLFAVREFAEQNEIFLNDQLFITGYSQGGHAAAALQRSIQQDFSDQFNITASAPLSGPYSTFEVGIEAFTSEEEYFSPGFTAASVVTYNFVYELYDDIEAILKPTYAAIAKEYESEAINLGAMNTQMVTALIAESGASITKNMFQDSIIQILEARDTSHPLIQAILDNDLTNWAPQAPTRLFYCRDDETVGAQNSIIAERDMKAAGAANLQAIDMGGNLNHIECVEPATFNVILFFGQFQEITTDVDEITSEDLIQIYPNPAFDEVYLSGISAGSEIQLFSLNGQLLKGFSVQDEFQSIDLSEQESGIYLLRIFDDREIITKKIILNK